MYPEPTGMSVIHFPGRVDMDNADIVMDINQEKCLDEGIYIFHDGKGGYVTQGTTTQAIIPPVYISRAVEVDNVQQIYPENDDTQSSFAVPRESSSSASTVKPHSLGFHFAPPHTKDLVQPKARPGFKKGKQRQTPRTHSPTPMSTDDSSSRAPSSSDHR